ncbi:putative leucine-rich repeat domain superfamily [Helianthus annuus]|nr:putative leucine-rich repeat domain superfamily [Helianthus annuus]
MIDRSSYPFLFFSLQGLELVYLENCTLEPPLTFNEFCSLAGMSIVNIEVSAQMLQRFISKCPKLVNLRLYEYQKDFDSLPGGNKFTFADFLQCVPMIETLEMSGYYWKMWDNEKLPVQQTPTNFLDPENYSNLKLDHLETLEMKTFNNLTLEMEFVKLIMDKSPLLKKVRLKHRLVLSVDEELEILSHFRRHHLVLLEEVNF